MIPFIFARWIVDIYGDKMANYMKFELLDYWKRIYYLFCKGTFTKKTSIEMIFLTIKKVFKASLKHRYYVINCEKKRIFGRNFETIPRNLFSGIVLSRKPYLTKIFRCFQKSSRSCKK
jgi:hypothetical protein